MAKCITESKLSLTHGIKLTVGVDIPDTAIEALKNERTAAEEHYFRAWVTSLENPGYYIFNLKNFSYMHSDHPMPEGNVAWSKINTPLKALDWPLIRDLNNLSYSYEAKKTAGHQCEGCGSALFCVFSDLSNGGNLEKAMTRIHFSKQLPEEITLPELKAQYPPREVKNPAPINIRGELFEPLHPLGIYLERWSELVYNSSYRDEDVVNSSDATVLWGDSDNKPRAWETIKNLVDVFIANRYIQENTSKLLVVGQPTLTLGRDIEIFGKELIKTTLSEEALEF